MKPLISFLFILVLITSCAPKKVDTKAEGEKLMQTSREWSQSVTTKDVAKILSYWAEDAVVISPGGEPVKGKEALHAMIEDMFKNPDFTISWEPQEAHISDDGSMGYLIEQNKVTINDSTTFYSNAVTVWRKAADGSWKDVADITSPKSAAK